MSVWVLLARDFNWKPIGREEKNPYPCGSFSGWAKPASMLPSEARYMDAGCVCHTNLEEALMDWKSEMVRSLLARAGEVSREVGTTVRITDPDGRQSWSGDDIPERVMPLFQELEAARGTLELFMVRMGFARSFADLPSQAEREQRFEAVDRPAPLAGPVTWTDKTYNPR